MKFGFDLHKVIDAEPKFFSELSEILIKAGHKVHIVTGSRITDALKKELVTYNMRWTKLFSITDHHIDLGNEVKFDDNNKPWIHPDLWNPTKGHYCRKEKIVFHIDDAEDYEKFFTTPFCKFNKDTLKFDWSYMGVFRGEFLFLDPSSAAKLLIELGEELEPHIGA